MTGNETSTLISSAKVSGTDVYNSAGEALGTIQDLMLNKKTGNVAYAVMSFGGFMGVGSKYHPLPWSLLSYDTDKGGYVVNIDKQQLEGAPAYEAETDPHWSDEYNKSIYTYYGLPPY